jgi:hypothetical protein
VQGALKKSRWLEFVDRLRAIRFGHDRLRWSGGPLSWLFPLLLCAGLGAVAGVQMHDDIFHDALGENTAIGHRFAAEVSKPRATIEFRGGGYYPTFQLQIPSSISSSNNAPDYRMSVQNGSFSRGQSQGVARYAQVEPRSWGNTDPAGAEKFAVEMNQTLARITAEYNEKRGGKNASWWGLLVGVPTGLVLLIGFGFLRGWRVRKLRSSQQALIADTQSAYALELQAMPEPLDLTQPTAVQRLITALEQSGSAQKPLLPRPTWPLRRLLAPF